ALGLALALLQKTFGIVSLPGSDAFLIDAYPVSISTTDVVFVGVMALLLCMSAALYPASRAAAIEPADAVNMSG
ncbi:MAG: ABC transporter permease, partial [Acidobacteria bacterium]|nr:ABC transporter permease [Acidobacteriota bacterium]